MRTLKVVLQKSPASFRIRQTQYQGETGQNYSPAERKFLNDNLHVRIHFIIKIIWCLASRHGSLNALFQIGSYSPAPILKKIESLRQLETGKVRILNAFLKRRNVSKNDSY